MKIVDKRKKNISLVLRDTMPGEVVKLDGNTGLWMVTEDASETEDTTLLVCLEDGKVEWRDNKSKVVIVDNVSLVIGDDVPQTETNRIEIFGDDVDDGSDKSSCGDCGDCGNRCDPAQKVTLDDTFVKLKKKKDKKK